MKISARESRAVSAQPVGIKSGALASCRERPRSSDVEASGEHILTNASDAQEMHSHLKEDFSIPELPRAHSLSFVLISPWDDPFYMGLNAIEIFSADGIRAQVKKIETDAKESYGDLKSLLYCKTCPSSDPRGMWMCKYRSCSQDLPNYGSTVTQLPIIVKITLKRKETIAMIRIWNYSESRVHAPRGVCRMRIDADDGRTCIFRGEISCAFTTDNSHNPASLGAPTSVDSKADTTANTSNSVQESCHQLQRQMGDTILFTTNEEILNKIARHDIFFEENLRGNAKKQQFTRKKESKMQDEKFSKKENKSFEVFSNELDSLTLLDDKDAVAGPPARADSADTILTSPLNFDQYVSSSKSAIFNIGTLANIKRPATAIAKPSPPASALSKRNADSALSFEDEKTSVSMKKRAENISDENANPKNKTSKEENNDDEEEDEKGIYGKVFHIELLANWGAPDLIGLTGIQFLGPHSNALNVDGCVIRYSDDGANGSTSATTNNSTGQKSLLRLLNRNNLTCSADEMWLHDWKNDTPSPPSMISFNFAKEVRLGGVSVWNYNASSELSYCGAKCVQFYVNGRSICGPVLLRRAPGCVYFDYVQDILFDRCHLFRPLTSRPTTKSINAFIFELRLLSSWGDEFYIGLNGVELYNCKNQLMRLKPQNLAAFPESVNVLPAMYGDPRSSDKLIDNVNDTKKPHHMWLTPLLPNNYARIFFIFDAVEFVSHIRIFNYRKTPQRGVRHISITADDLIIYSGEIPQSSANETGVLDVSLRDLD